MENIFTECILFGWKQWKRITGGSQAEMAAKRPELHESDDISMDFCRIKRRHGDVSSHFSQDAKPSPSVVLATTS